jgi:hypothetical protein
LETCGVLVPASAVRLRDTRNVDVAFRAERKLSDAIAALKPREPDLVASLA